MQESADGASPTAVLEVRAEGYQLNGRLLRPARVIVAPRARRRLNSTATRPQIRSTASLQYFSEYTS